MLLIKFDHELNSLKNLKIACELVKELNIKKDIPKCILIHKEYKYSPSSDGDWLGVHYYLKLSNKNNIIIFKNDVYATKMFVKIKLKKLKKLEKYELQ